MRAIEELAAEICTLTSHINAANYRWLMLVGEYDRRTGWSDGATQSCAHWLNWKCGIAMGAAREKVRVARALDQAREERSSGNVWVSQDRRPEHARVVGEFVIHLWLTDKDGNTMSSIAVTDATPGLVWLQARGTLGKAFRSMGVGVRRSCSRSGPVRASSSLE
jgi:hypothetical protein